MSNHVNFSKFHFYISSYEERKRSLETVALRHKDSNTFEDFTARIFNPIPFQSTNISASGSTITTQSGNHAPLTAALGLDHHRQSTKSNTTAIIFV